MTNTIFRLQSHKFSTDNIQTTLVCSKCDEVFSKEFPLDLEGQTIEFKCPVCNSGGEADLPIKALKREKNSKKILMKSKKKMAEKNLRKIISS
jgi:DNA-directed RNA polymerase subunit RPC12/RpoP